MNTDYSLLDSQDSQNSVYITFWYSQVLVRMDIYSAYAVLLHHIALHGKHILGRTMQDQNGGIWVYVNQSNFIIKECQI